MLNRVLFLALAMMLVIVLAGCAQSGDASKVIEAYLQARVESDADKLRNLSCAEWEEQALIQADSFRAMNAKLENMSCRQSGEDGGYTLVACDGKIVTTYNGEDREWALGTFRAIQEDGEWKMCGEA